MGGAGASSKKLVMDPVNEQLEEEAQGLSSGAGVPAEAMVAAVNGGA